MAPDEDRVLLGRPVRELEPEVLARYAAKALSTWGGVAEFRYFLPRLLECAAADAFVYPDPPVVFGKLAKAGWTEWDAEERGAIEVFLSEWWDRTLERFPSRPAVGTVLCSLGCTGIGVGSFLERWERLASDEAIRHLHEFVLHEVGWGPQPRLVDAYWGRDGREVVGWLTGGRAVAAVEAAFAREDREYVLRLLDEVHTTLDR
ncbi:hypothetical protein [Actinomadura vinacea]|uniref:hypothetical protein n=1 Tax=Actinomadura vinacea TaxID=115336 RepID=UPI0031D4D49F